MDTVKVICDNFAFVAAPWKMKLVIYITFRNIVGAQRYHNQHYRSESKNIRPSHLHVDLILVFI